MYEAAKTLCKVHRHRIKVLQVCFRRLYVYGESDRWQTCMYRLCLLSVSRSRTRFEFDGIVDYRSNSAAGQAHHGRAHGGRATPAAQLPGCLADFLAAWLLGRLATYLSSCRAKLEEAPAKVPQKATDPRKSSPTGADLRSRGLEGRRKRA